MRRVLIAAVVFVALVGCGSESATVSGVQRDDDAREAAVELLASAVESSMYGASTPNGGFVAFGIREADGRLGQNVVVFDPEGKPESSFDLPKRLWTRSSIVVGDDLYIDGTACEGVPIVDDLGNEQCPPGTPLTFRVDLRTGAASGVDMPSVDENPIRPTLYRAGSTLLAISTSPNGEDGGAAWAYSDGSWSTVERSPGMVCQAGDDVIASAATPTTSPSPGDPGAVDARSMVTPTASVYEPETKTWGKVVAGPTVEVPAMIGATTTCSAGALTLLAPAQSDAPGSPPGAIDFTALSFNADARRWTEPVDLGTFAAGTYPLPGPFGAKVLLNGGSTWKAYDPATGAIDAFSPPPTPGQSPFNANGLNLWTYDPSDNKSELTVTRIPA